MQPQDRLKESIGTSALAFRGYNVTNLGRTPELLAHASYGPTVASVLGEVSQTCSSVLGRTVDLVGRVRLAKETTDLTSYAEDAASPQVAEKNAVRCPAELLLPGHPVTLRARGRAVRELRTGGGSDNTRSQSDTISDVKRVTRGKCDLRFLL